MAGAEDDKPRKPSRGTFPWPGLFQRSSEPLFLLNRRQRILFVNRAWEDWAGLTRKQARGLRCRRFQTERADRTWRKILAGVLAPPREVRAGEARLVRRHVPARADRAGQWCEIDYLPLRDADGVLLTLARLRVIGQDAVTRATPVLEGIVTLHERHKRQWTFDLLDSRLPAMNRVAAQARLAATLPTPVLLVGPDGAGKETLARIIHAHSPQRDQPFVALDCRRLPPFAIGIVLFRSPAKLGAVYLNEPAALPRELQVRIAEGPLPLLFVGCPTNPAAQVAEGRLLEEFYQAVNLFRIDVVPLSQRRDDLPRLVNGLLQRLNADGGRATTGLTPDAWEVVLAHTWPGNLGELFRVLQDARRHSQGELIDGKDLPFPLRQAVKLQNVPPTRPPRLLELDKILEQVERRLIELALDRSKGNHTRAAEYLSIWRPRLIRRLKALQLGHADAPETEDQQD